MNLIDDYACVHCIYLFLTEFKVGAGLVGACERAAYHEIRNRIKSLFLFIRVIVAAWKRKLPVEVVEV